jgi:RNA methyltransferase, TrmH family
MITSSQNSKLKLVRSLMGPPKERRNARAFVVEGVRLVEEALTADWPFRFVLVGEKLSRRGQDLAEKLKSRGIDIETISDVRLASVSETESTQGILAVVDYSLIATPETLHFVLILDSIRDPGNLGTLLRTAAAAGVQAVFLPPETTDAFAPKVVRAGMGAHFRLPVHSLTWEDIRAATKSMHVFLADMQGSPCWQTDLRIPLALIVGGEAEGATTAARSLATSTIGIPMPGGAESLNAGVAGAILLFEVVRQRQSR